MRRLVGEEPGIGFNVSIHASVKDATTYKYFYFVFYSVSIHASVKDATYSYLIPLPFSTGFNPRICKRCDSGYPFPSCRHGCFNPRICKRCDAYRSHPPGIDTAVSIHASVKDATHLAAIVAEACTFQSTHL